MRLFGIVIMTGKRFDRDAEDLADENEAAVELIVNVKDAEIAGLEAEREYMVEEHRIFQGLAKDSHDAEIALAKDDIRKANMEIGKLLSQGERVKDLEMAIGELAPVVQEQLIKIMQNQKAKIKEIMNHA